MPDDSLSPRDKAIIATFEIVAFALGWNAVDRIVDGKPLIVAAPMLLVCICISYAGFKWPQIKIWRGRKTEIEFIAGTYPFVQPNGPDCLLYRVAVKSKGNHSGASLVISKIDPHPGQAVTEISLVQMHDRKHLNPDGRLKTTFDLHQEQPIYIDVLSKNRNDGSIGVMHVMEGDIDQTIPAGNYTITLETRGPVVAQRKFIAAVDSNGVLGFTPELEEITPTSIGRSVASNHWSRRSIYAVIAIVIAVTLAVRIHRRYYPQATTHTSGPPQPLTPLESLTVNPIKLVFKGQAIGRASSPQTVTVVNRGTAARIITGINTTGSFSQTNDCGSELMVGDSCNVEVEFTPTTIGLTHGNLEISCIDPLFPSTTLGATVDFSGSVKTSPARKVPTAPTARSTKQNNSGAIGNPSASTPLLSQECAPGAYCAQSTGQQGGITGQVFIDTHPHVILTDEQKTAIVDSLAQFAGRKCFIMLNNATQETGLFGRRLRDAMKEAGIDCRLESGMMAMEGGGVMPSPLFVQVGKNNQDLALALNNVLFKHKVVTAPIKTAPVENADAYMITITTPN